MKPQDANSFATQRQSMPAPYAPEVPSGPRLVRVGDDDPVYISIAEACRRWGVGKTALYAILNGTHPLTAGSAADARISAKKFGIRTLVDRVSGDRFFAALPPFSAN